MSHSPTGLHTLAAVLVVTGFVMASTLTGCTKHSEDDGHDHGGKSGATAAKADPHAGHNHGGASEGSHADEVRLSPDAIARYGIKDEPAQLWVLKPTVVAPARVAFNTEAMAHIGSPLRGRAVEVLARLGETVKAGQELVVIESAELGEAQAEYLQRKSAVLAAGPAVDLNKIAWERAKALQEQSQGISVTEVQRRESEYRAAVASVKTAEASAIAAESRLQLLGMQKAEVEKLAATNQIAPRHVIKAPIEGKVIRREITPGELVGPDRETLMVLADTRVLWVLADVPESKLAGIGLGAKAWVTIGSTTGHGDGAMTPKFEGTVSFIAPIVDASTRTAQVRIELPASLEGGVVLKPGMFAHVEIVASSHGGTESAPVVAVPTEAIQTVEGGPAVFVPVAGEANTFAKRAITIGKPVGGLVPIYSGLVEGERLVIAGSFILKAELGKGSAAHEH